MSSRKRSKKRKAAVQDEEPLDPDMEPQALIAQVRREVKAKLGHREDTVDLDHLVRTVRALLATNKEIWERLKPHMVRENESRQTFKRVLFPTIIVQTKTKSPLSTQNRLNFTTAAKSERKFFKVMQKPPESLTSLIALPVSTKKGLELHEHLFRTSLALHEDVLVPFLLSFKEYLEVVQVHYGKIEEWLMQPADIISFIEKHFDKKLELDGVDYDEDSDSAKCRPTVDLEDDSDLDDSDLDDLFSRPLAKASPKKRTGVGPKCDFATLLDDSDLDDSFSSPQAKASRKKRTSVGPKRSFATLLDDSDLDDLSPGLLSNPRKVERIETLKECKVSGRHFQTFDIRKQEDQDRLVTFLGCLSCL